MAKHDVPPNPPAWMRQISKDYCERLVRHMDKRLQCTPLIFACKIFNPCEYPMRMACHRPL